jgi:serine/threonine protein kinase
MSFVKRYDNETDALLEQYFLWVCGNIKAEYNSFDMTLYIPYIYGWNLKDAMITHPLQYRLTAFTRLAQDLINAVKAIHALDIVHQDIKLENVMYNRETTKFQLVDYGLACHLDQQEYWSSGTQMTTPPELLDKRYIPSKELVKPHDIWSVGCVLFSWFAFETFNLKDFDFAYNFHNAKDFYQTKFDHLEFRAPEIYDHVISSLQFNPTSRWKSNTPTWFQCSYY